MVGISVGGRRTRKNQKKMTHQIGESGMTSWIFCARVHEKWFEPAERPPSDSPILHRLPRELYRGVYTMGVC